MQIPEELLKKYNAAVPRYTSYPPANHFREFTETEHIGLIQNSNTTGPRNIAIYIHIPFCKRICHYCGCNSCALGKGSQVDPYIDALRKEIRMVSSMIDKSRKVTQIHYGGGTPNAISLHYLRELNDLIRSEFSLIDDAEIAIECNPEHLGFREADILLDAGFNRFSLGIQDFNHEVLRLVNRGIPAVSPEVLFRYIKDRKENVSVNLDFIYGLPGQTVASFSETIGKAIGIKPDRLVTFSYAHVPWLKKHQLILEKKGLPDSAEKMEMFQTIYPMLREAGYIPLGLDHFVLPGDDLYRAFSEKKLHRNFQGYCTRRTTGQVYAFGVTGISQLGEGYSQNSHDIEKYIADIAKDHFSVEKGYILSESQKIIREVITNLMCNKVVNFSEIAGYLNEESETIRNTVGYNAERFAGLAEDGLLTIDEDGITVTEKGTMFIRNVAVLFDPEYVEKNQTYSRTV